ncbi:glutamate-cysteine ligase family protein [Solemya velesiana gill symbiont]|uniref:Glutamate--cysteine ligase n=1 Tax=Solemya velesiana gill symbiont TaxID=1918948 RepID=A0A1T2KWD3_9GAMM|nr:glutamate-cysteine ligase family protein [Solemya velesiana gill symbiont]OOZ37134.1 glutamate--cysteine ligase [Solemya velesiana gill symbiont]
MGQEIADSRFSDEDFIAFRERLERETRLLDAWLNDGVFPPAEHVGGFELETWLVDSAGDPAPINDLCLEKLSDPLVVPELAKFNLELNGHPATLTGNALSCLADGLNKTWGGCDRLAAEHGARLAMIGILPTVTEDHLSPENMSPLQRYKALDEQLYRLRGGAPLSMDIEGRERLRFVHDDVMLESATTSFQIHLKVDVEKAVRFYNASKILSAPMVALSANSPYLFGADLWDETRIPLFEQAVYVGESELTKRVTFGIRYLRNSIMDLFEANKDRYPVLLPRLMEESEEQFPHLRLHNGTIWRWNRPLVGFNDQGVPHLRIEHRVVPAGPVVDDCMANAAFYFGVVHALSTMDEPPEMRLLFEQARDNFYKAARFGLHARVEWLDGKRCDMDELCNELLGSLARQGLEALGIERAEIERWLGIIERRLDSGQTGAVWQRAWVERHGRDMRGLTQAYIERQASGRVVSEWSL